MTVKRPDRWWMRWYVVRDEYVECAAFTRWGALRLVLGDWSNIDADLRVVRRTVWLKEHL